MNESENILPLVGRLREALTKTKTEVIFVDDSRDLKTVKAVAMANMLFGYPNLIIRIMHREGAKRWGGLAGAVTDGMSAAYSNLIAVMDGDLQHPPETLPAMLAMAQGNDIVVASRYCPGGSADGLDGGIRHLVSRASTLLAKVFFPLRLKHVSDPMTGFFLVNYEKVRRSRLRPKGFKILLEILATHPRLRKAEVPLLFAERFAGESHGSLKQGFEFLSQLINLRFGSLFRTFKRWPKTVQFGIIGGSVFVFGMALLYLLVEVAGVPILLANATQLVATFWLNYLLNRRITWQERQVSDSAASKFLISRSVTTVFNYLLFAWLIQLSFSLSLFGHQIQFAMHYLVANVITLAAVTALNYIISDRWAFAEAKPAVSQHERSSRRLHIVGLAAGVSLVISLFVISIFLSPNLALAAFLAITSIALFLQASLEAWRMLYSYREPESVDKLRYPAPIYDGKERFCIIVPARHESETLAHTLHLLARQTYPNIKIYAVVCSDDRETLAVANEAAETEERVELVVYPLKRGAKPSKPLQLNYVFERIKWKRFTIVTVFDAEDTVHPELLAHVAAAFRDPNLDIVQGGVQLMNHQSSWYSLHNVLEYYRWFNSAMAYNAAKEFMPLGGNTVFIRYGMLRKAGGWPTTLTEDCALGVLLSTRYQARTAVYYDPRLATQEETPNTLTGLFKQRVRWNQGFFHEWRKGLWLDMPGFWQRMLAGYVLLSALLLAIISIFMVISLLAILFLKAPVLMAMLMYLPLIPVALLTFLNAVFLHDFGKAFSRKVTVRQYATLLITQPLYQIVLNTAALWAVVRELRGDTTWYKTPHTGLHRTDTPSIAPVYAYSVHHVKPFRHAARGHHG
jgi:cellulose synthase/poly-beta-1,6-N-acetylglucosamine synthase-like glycosyltransferase/GT2 family glycosyltransferase